MRNCGTTVDKIKKKKKREKKLKRAKTFKFEFNSRIHLQFYKILTTHVFFLNIAEEKKLKAKTG